MARDLKEELRLAHKSRDAERITDILVEIDALKGELLPEKLLSEILQHKYDDPLLIFWAASILTEYSPLISARPVSAR